MVNAISVGTFAIAMSSEKSLMLDLNTQPRGVEAPVRQTSNVNDERSSLYPLSGVIENSIYVLVLAAVVSAPSVVTNNTGSDGNPSLTMLISPKPAGRSTSVAVVFVATVVGS